MYICCISEVIRIQRSKEIVKKLNIHKNLANQ